MEYRAQDPMGDARFLTLFADRSFGSRIVDDGAIVGEAPYDGLAVFFGAGACSGPG